MQGSIERVRAVLCGEMPDRAPMFDLIRNDAVISHFAGCELTVENGPEVVYKAYEPAIDATRPTVLTPSHEGTVVLADGRERRQYRWTKWTPHREYADSDAYAAAKRREIESSDPSEWGPDREQELEHQLNSFAEGKSKLGEVFFIPGIYGPQLMTIFGEVGLEQFSYYLVDCPDLMAELLEVNTVRAVTLAEHYPENHGVEVAFLGDDIAFHSGPLMNPEWMREHYFPRLARAIDAWHKAGIKVLFHSDGNLNPILDDLVEAGIDGLNPIEVLAGMDVGEIHRRYPHIFMAGGIDVSQLLPFGKPQEVRDAVKRALEAAGGRIMIGSSTELNHDVPLENFLAMRETVLSTPY